jgi:thioredoxin 1
MTDKSSSIPHLETAKSFLAATGQDNLSIVDFYTDWCGPCKNIAPYMEELAKKNPDIKFYKINAEIKDEKMQKVVKACEISAYPTFCYFRSSKCVKKVEGASPKAIEQAIKECN